MRTPLVFAGLSALAWLTGAPAWADSDHDRARAALVAGEVLPLPAVLERVGREHPGQVLAVDGGFDAAGVGLPTLRAAQG